MLPTAAAIGSVKGIQKLAGSTDEQGVRIPTAEEAKQELPAASQSPSPSPSSASANAEDSIQPDSAVVTAVRPARTDSIAKSSLRSVQSSPISVNTQSSGPSYGSQPPPSVRVLTKGSTLASGFPYHPALFDLRVHPIKWEQFTEQIVETTKLSKKERVKAWTFGAGAAVVITTPDSVHLARNKSRRYQEEKIKAGLAQESESSLGDLLRQWNERYFAQRGLLARLELSESALKSPVQQSKIFQREAHWYAKKEDRERKREERKFVIVVTQLYTPDELGHPFPDLDAAASVAELPDTDARSCAVEVPLSANKELPELPSGADRERDLSHLPDKKAHTIAELPSATQYAELEGDCQPIVNPSSKMTSADTHEKLQKNISHV